MPRKPGPDFKSMSLSDRFWRSVRKTRACWLWTASVDACGYGKIRTGRSTGDGCRAPVGAHRVAWLLQIGDIPPGMHVLHKCDNPRCVRPGHLFLGTHKINMEDKTRKGRGNQPKGAAHGRAKLTNAAVREIRKRLLPTARLAEKFGVHQSQIQRVQHGDHWREVSGG
jgi:hypothetical protein